MLADPHLDVIPQAKPSPPSSEDRVPSAIEFLESWFSRSPRERHYAVKRHLYRPYTEQSVLALAEMFESLAGDCARALAAECDLVKDYFMPFWRRCAARLLGVGEDQHSLLANVVNALSKALGMNSLDDRATRAVDACIRYLRTLVEHLLKIEDPPPTVRALRELAEDARVGGVWSSVSALSQLLTAGFHPTVTGAALAWRSLHEQPGLMTDVSTGRIEVSDLVNEVLRLHPPFPFAHRWAHTRCECQGITIEPAAHVLVDLRAVNRDPEVFDRPDDFVAKRDRGLSMSFGHGPHRCLGAALARLQIGIALRALLSLRPPVRPVGSDQTIGTVASGHLIVIKSLPCRRVADLGVTAGES